MTHDQLMALPDVTFDYGLAAIFEVEPEFLAEIMQLPRGAYIDAVEVRADQPGVIRMRVRGFGWPMRPGAIIPMARAIITRHHESDGTVSLNPLVRWNT